jgi:outer membrane murein-binding lipoprotein Lpp
MNELVQRLAQLNTHVQRLLHERDSARSALAQAQQAAGDGQRTQDVLQARIAELERENEVLRMVSPAGQSGQAPTDAKERIDELVREIDRCLELLKN